MPRWRERLVAVRQADGAPDDDEAAVRRLMTSIASRGELVEGTRELADVAAFNHLGEVRNFLPGDGLDHRGERDVLVHREELCHVVEPFLQFVELVAGKLPVARAPGEPQL